MCDHGQPLDQIRNSVLTTKCTKGTSTLLHYGNFEKATLSRSKAVMITPSCVAKPGLLGRSSVSCSWRKCINGEQHHDSVCR